MDLSDYRKFIKYVIVLVGASEKKKTLSLLLRVLFNYGIYIYFKNLFARIVCDILLLRVPQLLFSFTVIKQRLSIELLVLSSSQ